MRRQGRKQGYFPVGLGWSWGAVLFRGWGAVALRERGGVRHNTGRRAVVWVQWGHRHPQRAGRVSDGRHTARPMHQRRRLGMSRTTCAMCCWAEDGGRGLWRVDQHMLQGGVLSIHQLFKYAPNLHPSPPHP